MIEIPFTKLSTLGNNYLFIDLISHSLPPLNFVDVAKKMTQKDMGILSDGIILLSSSSKAALKMTIYNLDGTRALTCGNGLRMVGRYVTDNHLINTNTLSVETDANIARLFIDGDQITVDLGCATHLEDPHWVPLLSKMVGFTKEVLTDTLSFVVDPISMGNPHYILYTTGDHEPYFEELEKLSKKYDVNVGLATVLSETEMKLTTYERGAGFTGACGTNTAATVASAVARQLIKTETTITMHLPGGPLFVTYLANHHILACQTTDKICSGIFYYEQPTVIKLG